MSLLPEYFGVLQAAAREKGLERLNKAALFIIGVQVVVDTERPAPGLYALSLCLLQWLQVKERPVGVSETSGRQELRQCHLAGLRSKGSGAVGRSKVNADPMAIL